MSRKAIRSVLAILVLVATVVIFAYYLARHPDIPRQLRSLPLSLIGLLFGLYAVFFGTLVWVQRATLALCGIKLDRAENLLVVAYSSIINFFGPLQSGPAFRAAYLKRKHDISLKKYTLATLLYYGYYALFSGLFLMTYFISIWALLGVIIIIVTASLLLRTPKHVPARFAKLKLRHIAQLALATLAQVSVFAVIFYTELNSLGNHAGKAAALIYTGAANFALFVSVTPGAIGFREAFVGFTQGLHHLPSNQIITASLIDRGIYIGFLAFLAAIVFGLHAHKHLQPKPSDSRKS